MFKVIKSSPARDDCLLFGRLPVIKCLSDRKYFITNAEDGDYIYNLLIACLTKTENNATSYSVLFEYGDTTKNNFYKWWRKSIGTKTPSIICLYLCLCFASGDFYNPNCFCPLLAENLWWISQRDGTNTFKDAKAQGPLWDI